MKTASWAVAMLACVTTFQLARAVPPLLTTQQQRSAPYVLVGKVQQVYSKTTQRGNYEHTDLVAEFSIRQVEKQPGGSAPLRPGELVFIRYGRKDWIGEGPEPPGDSGHSPLPRGPEIRVFLRQDPKTKALDLMFPNGYEAMQE